MLHRHLNHSEWTLAAIDDVIARGRLDDWKESREAAARQPENQDRILRVAKHHVSDPYAQRYDFWNIYVRKQLAWMGATALSSGTPPTDSARCHPCRWHRGRDLCPTSALARCRS